MKTDTIAAIATAMTNSGIGIIRVSGEEAISIVHSVFINKQKKKCLNSYGTHTIHYGFIVGEDDKILDEVMVSVMKSPYSYTTEDTVEINCHGGIFIMQKVMNLLISSGARAAEPGEFTKRAFLNGRIDLTKAEAVMDMIQSKNDFALQSSVRQLSGVLFEKIKNLRQEILYEIALIESALDDPEHISLEGYPERLYEKTDRIKNELKKMIDSADDGRVLKEGIHTAIIGKPNVGKSSLLNLLAGEEKAIVTEIAGTTRDILEQTISICGIVLNIIDTAGIRETDDLVEKIGVERAKKMAEEADLVIYIIDASLPLDKNDHDIIKILKHKNVIVLLNKTDLDVCVTEDDIVIADGKVPVIRTSTKEGEGIDIFTDTVKNMFFHGKLSYNDEVYITNIRHKEALKESYESILHVRKSIEDDMPEDFYSIDLMSAYEALGKIIGEEVGEDLVNEIFSKFCMGK